MGTQPRPVSDYVSQTQPQLVTFASQNVAPPSPLYIDRDDRLIIRSISDLAYNGLLRCRLLLPSGEIVRTDQAMVFQVSAAFVDVPIELAEGFLLDVTLVATDAGLVRGRLFAQVVIARGPAATPSVSAVLISDYVTRNSFLGWPGGIIRSSVEGPGFTNQVALAGVGAGVDLSQTVTAGQRWDVQSFQFLLTTAGAVANREVQIIVDDGVSVIYFTSAAFFQVASTAVSYCFAVNTQHLVSANVTMVNGPLPELSLLGGYRVRTSTIGLQAADQFSAARMGIRRWQEVG